MVNPSKHRASGGFVAGIATLSLAVAGLTAAGADLARSTTATTVPLPASSAAVGLQAVVDPGPFPGSVIPTEDTLTIAGERAGESTFPIVEYPQVQPKNPGEMDFEHFHTGIEVE